MRKLIAEPIFIFFSVLASLWVDGYTDEIKEKDLEQKELDWSEWWYVKSGKRYETLSKENRIQKDQLWLESISELDMENWLNASGI